MKKDKLIRIYYKLIEKQNLFFLNDNSLNFFSQLKMRLIKRRILKYLDNDITEKLMLDKLLNKIDNNRNLKKLANIYNKKKSVESLQAYISYKNKLSTRFGFNNFQEVIIKKISLCSHSRMDIDKMEFQIKELKISNFQRNYNVGFNSVDIEDLLSFDKMVIDTYKNLEKNGYILEDSRLTCGALSLYMPHSKKGIIILKDKNNNDFDFIAHEIGHLLEYSFLDDKNMLFNILLVQPMKEFYSSLCEIRALESNKNIPEVTKLINEFYIQIKVLYIKIKFEEYLYTTQNKLNELNLNEKWKELTKKFFYEKSNDENFKWNLNYNISMDSFDKWMYFLGKFFANQVNKKETKIKKIYGIKGNDGFLEILKITNFDNDIYCEAKIINKRVKDNAKIYSRQLCNALLNVKRNYILAKQKNDFQIVKPFLQTFIKIKLKEEGISNYESILSKKIVEISSWQVTELFKSIKYNIPLLISTEEKVKYTNCSKEDMDKILDYLKDLVNLNERSLEIYKGDESFMVSFGTNDVKISLNYKEKNMFEFITKSCHELGHALYEQGNNKNHNRTFLSGAASTTMHEAIAIFYEKFIGKNNLLQTFISNELLDKPECFYFTPTPTPIRINASEKSYPIHILIRYEIEKGLLDGELKVDEIEKIWKEKYKEYLGIDIKNSNEGILQDPHWFNDKFAYFPSYIIGRAYAAQLKNEIDKFMAIDEMIKINDLSSLNNWLKENIYQYGTQYGPSELLKKSTKEELNCNYYLDSLHLER